MDKRFLEYYEYGPQSNVNPRRTNIGKKECSRLVQVAENGAAIGDGGLEMTVRAEVERFRRMFRLVSGMEGGVEAGI